MASGAEVALSKFETLRCAIATTVVGATEGQGAVIHSWWARNAVWFGVFLGLVLIGGAWAFATPIGGTPDERAHIYHAAGVAHGDFFPKPEAAAYETGVFHEVPKGLVRQCAKGGIPDFCDNVTDADAPVRVGTYVGRYNPIYYAVVGWPLKLWPSMTGLLVARLISVLLVAATLTGGVYCSALGRRHRAVIPALIVAATPMLFHLMGAVNPNALEIAAGILLFCALIRLTEPSEGLRAACIRLAGLAGVLLMTLRGFGPLWLAIGLAVMLLGVQRTRLRELARSQTVRRWSATMILTGILGVSWTVFMKATEGAVVATEHVSALDALKQMFLVYWGALLVQMVGNLGYLSTSLPGVVIFTWAAVVGFLVIGVFTLCRRPAKIRLLILIVACIAIPALSTMKSVNTLGFFWQGRYSLPLAVGVPLIGAQELATAGVLTGPAVRRLTRALIVLLLPAQLLALWLMLIRWQNKMIQIGIEFPLNPLSSTGWRPPLGALFPLATMATGLTIVGWSYLALVRRQLPEDLQSGHLPNTVEVEPGLMFDNRPSRQSGLEVPAGSSDGSPARS